MASLFCAFRFPSPPFSYSANLSHSNGTFPPMAVSMTRQGARKLSSSSSISVFSLSLPKLHSQIQTPTTPFTIVAAKGYKMKTHKVCSIHSSLLFITVLDWNLGMCYACSRRLRRKGLGLRGRGRLWGGELESSIFLLRRRIRGNFASPKWWVVWVYFFNCRVYSHKFHYVLPFRRNSANTK